MHAHHRARSRELSTGSLLSNLAALQASEPLSKWVNGGSRGGRVVGPEVEEKPLNKVTPLGNGVFRRNLARTACSRIRKQGSREGRPGGCLPSREKCLL